MSSINVRSGGTGAMVAVLLAVLTTGCAEETAPPFDVEGEGSVEGFAFYDADLSGTFNPAGGDSVLSGVSVTVFERGTQRAFTGATATTGASGRFEIEGLPAGTHDLWIDTTSVPEGVAFCQNPQPVTVYLGEMQYEELEARTGCVITIAEAESMDPAAGEFVTVSGIVTSFPGQIRGGYAYIEDETGGIRVFDSGLEGQGIEIGDRVELSGTLTAFNDDLQLTGVTLNQQQDDVAPVVPLEVTTGEVAAVGPTSADPLQGRLVHVENAEIVGAFGTLASSQNALIDDGTGATEMRIESGVVADAESLPDLYPAGTCYDITGVVGNFRGTAQIFPRSTEDIVEVACNN